MNFNNVAQLIDGILIPPAPYTVKKLHAELQKDEPVLGDIADIIATDVSLSSLVLRTINSPYFGLKIQTKSIHHATNLLGISNTINIVSALAMKRHFEESGGINLPGFWDSPVNIGNTAAYLSNQFPDVLADEAYMAGLFLNSGHLLLAQKFPDYKEFLKSHINLEDSKIIDVEDKQYRTNHAVLGYFMAQRWNLPKHISETILNHHNLSEILESKDSSSTTQTLLCVIKMAEHIDNCFWGIEIDHEWIKIKDMIFTFTGLSEPDYDDLHADCLEKLICG